MNVEVAKSRINEVLRPDTMTTSKGDFLVTHVPMKKMELYSKYDANDPSKSVKFEEAQSEQDVFHQFIENPGDKHQFILVVGESGAGKSHLIRWFNDRLINSHQADEVVLFIRRSDNTLKGTIKQLLDKPEIANINNREVYKRLVNATAVVDEKKLKSEILSKFIIEAANDNTEESTVNLRHAEKRQLSAFLKYKTVEDKLLDIDGPIDRIYSKIAQSNTVMSDVEALFKADDFEITDDELEDIQDNADRDTQRFANMLVTRPEKKQEIASYLNGFLDTVIQSCSGLEAGDFEEIFKDIRRELKQQGKKLTILIEDITSFTGVNTALLNALTTEHTGYGNEDLCRLSSVIGITSGYYKDTFKTNFRDRTTLFINIPTAVFSEDYLYEFVGKYLNAMSLTSDEVDEWLSHGALNESFPIHDCVEGKAWEYYELEDGRKLPLYPFTKAAIRNLYNYRLSSAQLRTPRYILQYIIEPVVKDTLYRINAFPNLELGRFNTAQHSTLRTKIFNNSQIEDDIKERLYLFMCLWGNGEATKIETKDGMVLIAGISVDVYKDLGLPIIDNVQDGGRAEGGEGSGSAGTNNGGKENKVAGHTGNAVAPETAKKITQALEVVEKWLQGSELNIGATTANVVQLSKARDNIISFLEGAINWQAEGVSQDNLTKISNSRYKLIGFERQKRGLDLALYVLPANRNTQTILEAFIRWELEGKGTWNFENGDYFSLAVETWTLSITKDLVKAVNTIGDRSIRYYKYAIASEMYRQLLWGQIDDWSTYTFEDFMNNDVQPIDSENVHSKEWNQLLEYFKRNEIDKDIRSTAFSYFNIVQGKGGASKVYLNHQNMEEVFSELKKDNLVIRHNELADPISPRDQYRKYFVEIESRIHGVFHAEKDKVSEYVQGLNKIAGKTEFTQAEIEEFVKEAKAYYEAVDNAKLYAPYDSAALNKLKKEKKQVSESLKLLIKIIKEPDEIAEIVYMAKDPVRSALSLSRQIEKLLNDIEKVKAQIDNKKEKLTGASGDFSTSLFSEEETLIEDGKLSLSELEE